MILDRLAFAMDDIRAADTWAKSSGAGVVAWTEDEVLHARQYEFAGGGRLEFLVPRPLAGQTSPIRRFLDHNQPRIHHLTIRVDDFDIAVRRLRRRGFPVGRVQSRVSDWREGYLAPADTGNILVQIGWHGGTDESWAEAVRHTPETPRPDGTVIVGAKLRHVDLDRARRVWEALGAEVTPRDWGALAVNWPGGALGLVIERGPSGPTAMLLKPGAGTDGDQLPAVLGPVIPLPDGDRATGSES